MSTEQVRYSKVRQWLAATLHNRKERGRCAGLETKLVIVALIHRPTFGVDQRAAAKTARKRLNDYVDCTRAPFATAVLLCRFTTTYT